ncbi:MAG: hypothetical protein KGI66_00705 [Patescibacteria group bacterium]|nr:hypothetical protein [Patescibacteria group bacterium]
MKLFLPSQENIAPDVLVWLACVSQGLSIAASLDILSREQLEGLAVHMAMEANTRLNESLERQLRGRKGAS